MEYNEYAYLWPPRPETKIPKTSLGFFKGLGYAAQIKKNGTCTLIFARGNEVIFKTRHGDAANHKAWKPRAEHIAFFSGRSKKWNVYVAELLHSKTPHIKDQLYIFDQIVSEGIHLVGKTFMERQAILHAQWPKSKDEGDQMRVHPFISLAKTFTDGFEELWSKLKSEDEGLVLKRKDAKLERCIRQRSNDAWQVKCRRPASNYTF